MAPKVPYGSIVRKRLQALGRSQNDLAKALYFTPPYISMIVNGKPPAPGVKMAIDRQLDRWEEEQKEALHAERNQC